VPIGENKINRWFAEFSDEILNGSVRVSHDNDRGLIIWSVGTLSLFYSYRQDKFGYDYADPSDFEGWIFFAGEATGVTLDDLGAPLPFYPEDVDDSVYEDTRVRRQMAIVEDGSGTWEMFRLAGNIAPVRLQPAWLSYNQNRNAFVDGAYLVGNIQEISEYVMTLNTKDAYPDRMTDKDTETYKSASENAFENGFFPITGRGKYFSPVIEQVTRALETEAMDSDIVRIQGFAFDRVQPTGKFG